MTLTLTQWFGVGFCLAPFVGGLVGVWWEQRRTRRGGHPKGWS